MNKSKKVRIKKLLKMEQCKYCGSTENLTLDHKVPTILGGSDDIKNLQCLCKRCNGIKSGMSHNTVKALFSWFLEIQATRIEKGIKPWHGRKRKIAPIQSDPS